MQTTHEYLISAWLIRTPGIRELAIANLQPEEAAEMVDPRMGADDFLECCRLAAQGKLVHARNLNSDKVAAEFTRDHNSRTRELPHLTVYTGSYRVYVHLIP